LGLWRILAVLTVRYAYYYAKRVYTSHTHLRLSTTVAVTRAKALLIIVGDPLVLGLDPLWRAYLNTVHAGGGWRGRPIPWEPEDPVNPDGGYDVDLRIRALSTSNALAERLLDGGDFDASDDRPFREVEE
jgi:helicase MOV-10